MILDKAHIVHRETSSLLPRLPVLESRPRQLDLGLLVAGARPLALVVSSEEQDPVAVGMAEDAEQNFRLPRCFLPCALPFSGQHLSGVLIQTKLEDAASKTLAKVRSNHVRTFVLKDLEHRDANRAALSGRQPAQPVEDRLMALVVLVELKGVHRRQCPVIDIEQDAVTTPP
jgi:hypothetical protein